MIKRLPFLLLLMLLGIVSGALAQTAQRQAPLTIATADGRQLAFHVELADTDEQRATGLMYRSRLAADAGMLFDFKRDLPVAMWMKNTFIPLDILFITADGRIAGIVQRTVPQSLATIASPGHVRAVLEVNGGTVERLGIAVDDRVHHPMFVR